MNTKREAIERVYKCCTWGNTEQRPDDWEAIIDSSDIEAKRRLFDLLFRENAEWSDIHALFTKEEIARFVSAYSSEFSWPHVERRRRVWRFVVLGDKLPVPGLDWIVKTKAKND